MTSALTLSQRDDFLAHNQFRSTIALFTLFLLTGFAFAQDLNAAGAPRYGRHALAPGFSPAPFTYAALSGGDIDVKALNLGANCLGFAARDPDFALELSVPFDLVTFLIASDIDTTLIVNLPNGSWACNDDTNGLNPALVLHRARRRLPDLDRQLRRGNLRRSGLVCCGSRSRIAADDGDRARPRPRAALRRGVAGARLSALPFRHSIHRRRTQSNRRIHRRSAMRWLRSGSAGF